MDSSNDGSDISKCSKCKKEKTSEVWACKNGHGLCDDCWDDADICGLCPKKATDALNNPLFQFLDRIAIICKYNTNGCKELLRVDGVENHEKFCYYRDEHCCTCEKEFPLPKINDHLKYCYSNDDCETGELSEEFNITWYKPMDNETSYQVLVIRSTQTFFLVKLMDFLEKSIICVQYLGEDQENAGKYKYDIKINKELPDSYMSFTGFCEPYVSSDEETKKQNFNAIFLKDKAFFGEGDYFKMEMELTISEVNPPKNNDPKNNDPKKPEGGCIIQ